MVGIIHPHETAQRVRLAGDLLDRKVRGATTDGAPSPSIAAMSACRETSQNAAPQRLDPDDRRVRPQRGEAGLRAFVVRVPVRRGDEQGDRLQLRRRLRQV